VVSLLILLKGAVVSHFTVLVVTDEKPTEEVLSKALQPFHEFECTGVDDQYIVDRDITEEVMEGYKAQLSDDQPETLDGYVGSWHGYKIIEAGDAPNLGGDHKYGYGHRQEYGSLKVIDRTNPNKKWDWWTVGGRWSGKFLSRNGEKCDTVRVGNIDIAGMQDLAEKRVREEHADLLLKCPGLTFSWMPWSEVREAHKENIDVAREVYHAQPEIEMMKKARIWECDEFLVPLEKRVEDARKYVCGTFAVLKDNEWIEKGRMGWWACVSDEKEDWPQIFARVWDSIRDDQWVTMVDCHI
jgi:hypothetical protein